MKKITGITVGVLLVVCGIIYGLEAFGIVNINFSLDGWWTLFIIIPCLEGIFAGKEKTANVFGLILGVLLLLAARGVFNFDVVWKVIAPLIVVAIGVKMIKKSLCGKNEEKDGENGN